MMTELMASVAATRAVASEHRGAALDAAGDLLWSDFARFVRPGHAPVRLEIEQAPHGYVLWARLGRLEIVGGPIGFEGADIDQLADLIEQLAGRLEDYDARRSA